MANILYRYELENGMVYIGRDKTGYYKRALDHMQAAFDYAVEKYNTQASSMKSVFFKFGVEKTTKTSYIKINPGKVQKMEKEWGDLIYNNIKGKPYNLKRISDLQKLRRFLVKNDFFLKGWWGRKLSEMNFNESIEIPISDKKTIEKNVNLLKLKLLKANNKIRDNIDVAELLLTIKEQYKNKTILNDKYADYPIDKVLNTNANGTIKWENIAKDLENFFKSNWKENKFIVKKNKIEREIPINTVLKKWMDNSVNLWGIPDTDDMIMNTSINLIRHKDPTQDTSFNWIYKTDKLSIEERKNRILKKKTSIKI